jgi:O-antigen ligase
LGRIEHVIGFCLALPGLLLVAFGALYDVSVGNSGLALLLVATVAVTPIQWRSLGRDPLCWMTLAFAGYVLVGALLLSASRPDWDYTVWNAGGDWLLTPFLGSLVAAYWLGRYSRLIPWLIVLLIAGYLVRAGNQLSPDLIAELTDGQRATFGDSANNFGAWSLIVVLAVFPLVSASRSITLAGLRYAAYLVCALVLVVATAGLVFSQARASWLAAIVAVPVLCCLSLRYRWPSMAWKRLCAIVGGGMLAAAVIVALSFGSVIADRMDDHSGTIAQIASGQFDDLPSDSPGYRIRMYIEGLHAWAESPLLGHGPGMSVIALAETQDQGIRRFNDFHNAYLVIAVEFGALGLALIATLVAMAVRTARRAIYGQWLSPACGHFLFAALVAFIIFQLFQYSIHSYRGPFVLAVLMGIALAYRFARYDSENDSDVVAETS